MRDAFEQPRGAGGRFVNLDGSWPAGLPTVLRWMVWDRLIGRRRRAPDRARIPFVMPELVRLARPPAGNEPARLTWLGHASFLVQLDGVSLLVDPALHDAIFGGIARNVPPGVPIDSLPPIDAQLVTHNHYDHLDLPTLQAVNAPVVAGLGLERWFRVRGLHATELGWWRETAVGPVRVTFVPAHHWSRRGPLDTNASLWGGFVIEGSTATIYHSGDTAYFTGFREIAERFPSIDAALLPIGAYEPGWFMLRQHMAPEQALRHSRTSAAARSSRCTGARSSSQTSRSTSHRAASRRSAPVDGSRGSGFASPPWARRSRSRARSPSEVFRRSADGEPVAEVSSRRHAPASREPPGSVDRERRRASPRISVVPRRSRGTRRVGRRAGA
jgi:L-ascorbate metabolism protein UlaG (beta-lactamase superfamily)